MSDKKMLSLEADKILDKLYFMTTSLFPNTDNLCIKVYNFHDESHSGSRICINNIELEYYIPIEDDVIRTVYKKLCENFHGELDQETGCVKIDNPSVFIDKLKKRILKK